MLAELVLLYHLRGAVSTQSLETSLLAQAECYTTVACDQVPTTSWHS